jgi:hypothetical protein
VTEYQYDAAGRLVRAVTTREPEFSPDQTAALLAYKDYMADLGPHGIPMSEAMDPANAHGFVAADGGIPSIDFAEKAVQDAQDAYYQQWPNVSKNGHKWSVVRLPPPEKEPDLSDVDGSGDVLDGPSL